MAFDFGVKSYFKMIQIYRHDGKKRLNKISFRHFDMYNISWFCMDFGEWMLCVFNIFSIHCSVVVYQIHI